MTKSRLDKSQRDADYKAKLLLAKPKFREAINKLRAKWGIPNNGFGDNGQLVNWLNQMIVDDDSYKPTLDDRTLEANRQSLISKHSHSPLENIQRLLRPENMLKITAKRALWNDIGSVLKSQKLSPRWFGFVENYLLLNKEAIAPSGMEYRVEVDHRSGQEVIMLKITDDATTKDIESVWPHIRKERNKLSYKTRAKSQPVKSFDRDAMVYAMHNSGESIEAIIISLEKDYPKTNGDPYVYDEVYKLIARHKERLA